MDLLWVVAVRMGGNKVKGRGKEAETVQIDLRKNRPQLLLSIAGRALMQPGIRGHPTILILLHPPILPSEGE